MRSILGYISILFVRTPKILLHVAIYTSLLSNVAFAEQKKTSNKTEVEADYLKGGKDFWKARGNIIVKREDVLLNAEEVDAVQDSQQDTKKGDGGNSKKLTIDAQGGVKLRTNENHIMFAKSLFYDERSASGRAKNTQIFPGPNRPHTEIYATQANRQGNLYYMTNATMCPCKLFKNDAVEEMRKNKFSNMTTEEEILKKPDGVNPLDNKDEELHDDLKTSAMSVNSDSVEYDDAQKLITMRKNVFRIFGIPVFYLPKMSVHTDDSGDSGFLIPRPILFGLRQFGVEVPFHWKIKDNMDLTISRMQYFDISNIYGQKTAKFRGVRNDRMLKDLYRFRESSTNFRFRHLLSNKYGNQNYYYISGMVTDWTQQVSDRTGRGSVYEDGSKRKGLRWFLEVNSKLQFSPTTFLRLDQIYTSDRKFLYTYKIDTRQVQKNSAHLYDVNPNRYYSAEIFTYQPMILNLDRRTIPLVFPVFRAHHDFKENWLGGKFYFNFHGYYLNRQEGLSHTAGALDLGYHLPYTTKHGIKLTLDTMIRNQYDNVQFNNGTSSMLANALGTQINRRNALHFFFGNYANLLTSPYYYMSRYASWGVGSDGGSYNGYHFLNFNKLQAEYPIIIKSVFGKTIFNPKVALRYSPNSGRGIYVPVDDNFGMQMNYHNAFSLMQSSGLGIVDRGLSAVYGFDFTHRFTKDIEVYGGLAHNTRLDGSVNEQLLADFSGYRRTVSDLMGNVGVKAYGVDAGGYFNYDIHRKEMRMLGSNIGYGNKYFSLSVNYDTFSKYATFFGQKLDMISFYGSIKPVKGWHIFASVNYNISGMQTQNGWKKPDFTYYRIGTMYDFSCFRVGFIVTRNNMRMVGLPSITSYRFVFRINGFGS